MNSEEQTDWGDVRKRIDDVAAAIEDGFALSPEKDLEILRSRARLLGKEPQSESSSEILEAVEFGLAGERYAIPLRHVLTVSVCKDLTPVPCTPGFVAGIINLRGEIRTVIDLGKLLDLPGGERAHLNRIIFLRHEEMRLGILADSVAGTCSIELDGLQRSLPTLTGVRAEYLQGITPDRVAVLDAAKILADPRLVVDEEIGQ